MNHLTPTQRHILQLLPATPGEIAQALYGRATASERNLVYVHIALLRRRLTRPELGRRECVAQITSRPLSAGRQTAPIVHDSQSADDGYAGRIIYELNEILTWGKTQ